MEKGKMAEIEKSTEDDATDESKDIMICETDGKGSQKSKIKHRETWSNQIDFMLALIGASVGLANVWRFPYLCYKNGGGAFLIPYFTCLLFGGIPQLLLEIGLGQYANQGVVTAWNICPIFKGLGIASILVQLYLYIYYIVIMAWAIYYLFMSFNSTLPYSTCGNPWNTVCCTTNVTEIDINATASSTFTVLSQLPANMTDTVTYNTTNTCLENGSVSSAIEFWNRKILQIHLSDGIEHLGGFNWQLFLCSILAWVLVFLCIFKGVKSSGKVVYFTAPFPYVLLTILLVRAVTLPNALEGISYYLRPDITRLRDSQVWMDAATQIFFSYSIGHGVLIALGSYNRHKHNFIRDALIFAGANSGTSLYSGFVIFAVLGFMAGKQGVDVADVAKSGPGLAFIVYPEAISQMPVPVVWAVLFFFMLIILGIDSEFVGVEGLITAFVDLFPNILRKGNRREWFCLAVCTALCIAGMPMVTYGGMYIFQLFDYYAASGFVLLWSSLFESVAIGWIYGAKRFMNNVTEMTEVKWISPYLITSWVCFVPLFTGSVFIFSLVKYKPLTYVNVYVYPWWGYMLGWMFSLSAMTSIPFYAFYQLTFSSGGSLKERWILLTTPCLTHCRSETLPDGVTVEGRHKDQLENVRYDPIRETNIDVPGDLDVPS